MHTAGGAAAVEAYASAPEPEVAASTTEPLSLRVQRLEGQVAALTEELRALKAKLGE